MNLEALQKEFQRRAKLKEWRKNFVLWAEERMGISPENIIWSLHKEYQAHKWCDLSNPITPDPLLVAVNALSNKQDVGIEAATGVGKMQDLNSLILTPDGWVRMGDIKVGDYVIGSNGTSTKVLQVHPNGKRDLYKVTMSDGSWTFAGAEHLWSVIDRHRKCKGLPYKTMTTAEIQYNIDKRYEIPLIQAPDFKEKKFDIDPYVLGVLIGDGCLTGKTIRFTTADKFIVDEIELLENGSCTDLSSDYDFSMPISGGFDSVPNAIKKYNLYGKKSWEKHIPEEFLFGSKQQRISLLQGLMDTDGTINKKSGTSFSYCTTSSKLADDVRTLVQSLGGTSKVHNMIKWYTHLDEKKKGRKAYRVQIQLPNEINPFRLPRKANLVKDRSAYGLPRRIIESIEFSHNAEAQCITVDAKDNLYVTDEYIVTHNTWLAALITYWWLDCYPEIRDSNGDIVEEGGIVLTISSKQDQLKKVLWKELRKQWPRFSSLHPNAEFLDLQIRMNPSIESKESWGAVGITASVGADEQSASKIQGYHGHHMLIICDEATGIPKPIIEAIDNTAVGGNNLRLFLGNPNSQSDTLHQMCMQNGVTHVRICAEDHPNCVTTKEVIPGAATSKANERRLEKYQSPTHPMVLSRTHGISPSSSGRTLFPSDILDLTYNKLSNPIKILNVPKLSKGVVKIYEEKKNTHINRYCIFADVAGDKSENGDYHAAIVYDRIEQKPVALIHQRGPRKDYISSLLKIADRYTIEYGYTGEVTKDGKDIPKLQKPLLCYEQQSVGGLHLDPRIEKYGNLFHKRNLNVVNSKTRAAVGWDTTRSTRPAMIDELEEWALHLYEFPERMVIKELWKEAQTFAWNEDKNRYEHEDGHHDDVIIAMAGCLIVDVMIRKPISIERFKRPKPQEKRHIDKITNRQTKNNSFDVDLVNDMFDIL